MDAGEQGRQFEPERLQARRGVIAEVCQCDGWHLLDVRGVRPFGLREDRRMSLELG